MSFDRVQLDTQNPAATDGGADKPAFVVRGLSNAEVNPRLRTAVAPTSVDPVQKGKDMNKVSLPIFLVLAVVVVALGGASGYLVRRVTAGSSKGATMATVTAPTTATGALEIKVGAVYGSPDEGTFKDSTEGVLIKGGLNGEGSHTLLREGGVSQNVYLTSSVVDLDQFVDKSVKVWGETFKGQKAGWLMDVGRLEVKSLSATKPAWYAAQQAKSSATPAGKAAQQGE